MCFSNKTRLDVSYSVIVGFRRIPVLRATVVVKNKAYPPCCIKKKHSENTMAETFDGLQSLLVLPANISHRVRSNMYFLTCNMLACQYTIASWWFSLILKQNPLFFFAHHATDTASSLMRAELQIQWRDQRKVQFY